MPEEEGLLEATVDLALAQGWAADLDALQGRGGLRFRRAIASASRATSVRRWSAIAQPTTRRECASRSTTR